MSWREQLHRRIGEEWFWRQANVFPNMTQQIIDKEEAKEMLRQRSEDISPDA